MNYDWINSMISYKQITKYFHFFIGHVHTSRLRLPSNGSHKIPSVFQFVLPVHSKQE